MFETLNDQLLALIIVSICESKNEMRGGMSALHTGIKLKEQFERPVCPSVLDLFCPKDGLK